MSIILNSFLIPSLLCSHNSLQKGEIIFVDHTFSSNNYRNECCIMERSNYFVLIPPWNVLLTSTFVPASSLILSKRPNLVDVILVALILSRHYIHCLASCSSHNLPRTSLINTTWANTSCFLFDLLHFRFLSSPPHERHYHDEVSALIIMKDCVYLHS